MVNFTCMSCILYNNLNKLGFILKAKLSPPQKNENNNWRFALCLSHFTFFWVCVFIYILLHSKKMQMPFIEIRWKTQKSSWVESRGKTRKLSIQTGRHTSQRWPGRRAPCFRGRCRSVHDHFKDSGPSTLMRNLASPKTEGWEKGLSRMLSKRTVCMAPCSFRTHSTAPAAESASAGLLLLLPPLLREKTGLCTAKGKHPAGCPPSQPSVWLWERHQERTLPLPLCRQGPQCREWAVLFRQWKSKWQCWNLIPIPFFGGGVYIF